MAPVAHADLIASGSYVNILQQDSMRVMADLSYYIWQQENNLLAVSKRTNADITVPILLKYLTGVKKTIGLKPPDLVIIMVLLRRYYGKLAGTHIHGTVYKNARYNPAEDWAVSECAGDKRGIEYHRNFNGIVRILHATYISQVLVYDAPLVKRVWNEHSGVPFRRFLSESIRFAMVLDFNFYFEEEEFASAFAELAGPVEEYARPLFVRLAEERKARPQPVAPPVQVPVPRPISTTRTIGIPSFRALPRFQVGGVGRPRPSISSSAPASVAFFPSEVDAPSSRTRRPSLTERVAGLQGLPAASAAQESGAGGVQRSRTRVLATRSHGRNSTLTMRINGRTMDVQTGTGRTFLSTGNPSTDAPRASTNPRTTLSTMTYRAAA